MNIGQGGTTTTFACQPKPFDNGADGELQRRGQSIERHRGDLP